MIPLGNRERPRRKAWVTWLLALACAATYAWQLSLGDDALATLSRLAPSSARIVGLEEPFRLPAQLFTSMFLHGGLLHLLGNLAFLLVFCDDVEARIGPRRFLILYLVSGIVATIVQAFATPRSTLPIVGASGAIAGVLGAFLVLFPKARLSGIFPVGCLLLPMRSRAFFFIPGWFALQLAAALWAPPGTAQGGVAFYAHLAGFVAGPILLFLTRRR